jgi:hypothetical protein
MTQKRIRGYKIRPDEVQILISVNSNAETANFALVLTN